MLFLTLLLQVIYRSTLEHPFHCLYVVLALSNATKDDQFPKSGYVTGVPHKNTAGSRLRKSVSPSSIDEVCYDGTVHGDSIIWASNIRMYRMNNLLCM